MDIYSCILLGFIQKPFNISEISKKIREVLDEGKSTDHD